MLPECYLSVIRGNINYIKHLKFTKTILIYTLFIGATFDVYCSNGSGEKSKTSTEYAFTLLLNISETPKFGERHQLRSEYTEFANSLKEKQSNWKNDHKLLEHLFYKVHQKYLKKYVPYQSFQDLFETGTYGCLTGTALFAFLLDELGYEYEIIETNYHMFLKVQSNGKTYLLESTDPFSGFEHLEKEIEKRIADAHLKNKSGGEHHTFTYDIYRSITFTDLIGLQYYNVAIDAFNRGNLKKALYCLNEASKINKSERISEMLTLMLNSVNHPASLEKVILNYDELSELVAVK